MPIPEINTRRKRSPALKTPQPSTITPKARQNPTSAKEALCQRRCTNHKKTAPPLNHGSHSPKLSSAKTSDGIEFHQLTTNRLRRRDSMSCEHDHPLFIFLQITVHLFSLIADNIYIHKYHSPHDRAGMRNVL